MLFEESINSWALQVCSFLSCRNLFTFSSYFKNNITFNNYSIQELKRNENDIYIGYAVLFWSVTYLIYEKWLQLLLRRKCFPLIQRNRITSTVWDCIFCIIAANDLLYIFFLSSETSTLPNLMKFKALLYKSFYIHHAGVNIFILGAWMKGWSDLLFAFFAFNRHWERRDTSIVFLLFLKVTDTTILALCRLLLCFSNKPINKAVAKALFVFHCLTWSYTYISFVPEHILWGSNSKNSLENFHMWMWFVSECLNSVWLRLFCGLDAYLFPPPSKEAVDFANRLKEQKAFLEKKPVSQNAKKAELIKTLTCIMSVKKKLQRIRKAKEAKLTPQPTDEEEENVEMDSDKATKKHEIMQTLIKTRGAMPVRREIQMEAEFQSSELEEQENKIKGADDKKIEETSV